ncbi:MAG: response regulator [Anaerolineae bacterium]|nr:response regulator [Anaerolineae bacterium]
MARILLVEDDPSLRLLMVNMLRQANHDVVEAANGLEALTILKHDTAFSLMISDVMMPYVDGVRLVETVHRTNPTLPVIMVSAHAGRAIEARQQGAVSYLPKPFSRQQLTATVNHAL